MRWLLLVAGLMGVGLMAGCSARTDLPPRIESDATTQQPELTPELAKEALLDWMRTKPGGDFAGLDADEWAKVPLEKAEDGWYDFGCFDIHPGTATYKLVPQPRPGAHLCVSFYGGSFAVKEGRWVAGAPVLESRGHQFGD